MSSRFWGRSYTQIFVTLQTNIIQFILLMKKLKFRVVKELVQGHTADMWCVELDLSYKVLFVSGWTETSLCIPWSNPTTCPHLIPTTVQEKTWTLEKSRHCSLLCGVRKLRNGSGSRLYAAYKKSILVRHGRLKVKGWKTEYDANK